MRALTFRPHTAWAITYGAQRYVPRGSRVRYVGEVAVYAGSTWDPSADTDPRYQALEGFHRDNVPLGAVVALAQLAGCHKALHEGALECCHPWGRDGTWHVVLDEVRPLARPVECEGRPSLWTLPDRIASAVRAQVEAVAR